MLHLAYTSPKIKHPATNGNINIINAIVEISHYYTLILYDQLQDCCSLNNLMSHMSPNVCLLWLPLLVALEGPLNHSVHPSLLFKHFLQCTARWTATTGRMLWINTTSICSWGTTLAWWSDWGILSYCFEHWSEWPGRSDAWCLKMCVGACIVTCNITTCSRPQMFMKIQMWAF